MAKIVDEPEWNDQMVEPQVVEFVISVVEEKLPSGTETELPDGSPLQSALPSG